MRDSWKARQLILYSRRIMYGLQKPWRRRANCLATGVFLAEEIERENLVLCGGLGWRVDQFLLFVLELKNSWRNRDGLFRAVLNKSMREGCHIQNSYVHKFVLPKLHFRSKSGLIWAYILHHIKDP